MNSKKRGQRLFYGLAFGAILLLQTTIVGRAAEIEEPTTSDLNQGISQIIVPEDETNAAISTDDEMNPLNTVETSEITEDIDTAAEIAGENTVDVEDVWRYTSGLETEENMAFYLADDYIPVYSEPSVASETEGKLYSENVAYVLARNEEWVNILSGNLQGYVKSEDLVIGEAAVHVAELLNVEGVQVTASALNVRMDPSMSGQIVGVVHEHDMLTSAGEVLGDWTPIEFEGSVCYVFSEYVIGADASYTYGETHEEADERIAEEEAILAQQMEVEALQAKGQEVIDYASQFIGNPYVWGGTDPVNGADCSGFVQAVYRNFGVELPRTSSEQRSAGVEVAYEDALPGDILCYDGHVGLYVGDGQMVNAIGAAYGIDISSATYREILSVRRVIS